MLILKRLKINGFRAYMGEKEFIFDNPMILLFGGNHLGKSSALNAVEWCLFGNECIGAKSGIRERIDWEIPNRNLSSRSNVFIELELEDENKTNYKIYREWLSKTKDELKVGISGKQILKGQDAREKLSGLLKLSYRDFLTMVYQHQEVIRAIFTQEPKKRNDAIDRLLGLSDYRNILTGLDKAKLKSKQKIMGANFDSFTSEIEVALRTRESDLKDKKEEAIQKGVKKDQFTKARVLRVASEIQGQLIKFSSEINLSLTDFKVPKQIEDLYSFHEFVDKEIKRFRAEMPDVKKQQGLYKDRSKITDLKINYEQKKGSIKEVKKEMGNFIKKNGDEKSLIKEKNSINRQIDQREKELKEADAKAAVIKDAIYCFNTGAVDVDICPVCGKKNPNLLQHLEIEWNKKFEKRVGRIKNKLDELHTKREYIKNLYQEFIHLKKRFDNAKRETQKIIDKISKELDRKIFKDEDPFSILNNELERIEKELKQLEKAIQSKQHKLDIINKSLEHLRFIIEILNQEEKKEIVEKIKQSSEYIQLEKLKDQMATLVDDIEKIKQAVSEASHEEAQQKVAAAESIIDNYFRIIANNPAVSKVEFLVNIDSRTSQNSYVFKDHNGEDLTPILSQGDLNAMALSIFLGMASLKGTSQQFGFIMLDDPSQSLGSEHKEKLVEVLNDVLKEKMVLLSSMDNELQDLVLSRITKTKTKYIFSNWSPKQGPKVIKE